MPIITTQFPASASVSNLNGLNGFAINGFPAGGEAGASVRGAGDVNGDGIADLVIGAPFALSSTGMSYVIFGQSGLGSSGSVDVSSLTGSNGFSITGFPTTCWGGYSVSGAGDVNADGIADLVIGVPSFSNQAGMSCVLFGQSGLGSSGSVSVSSLTGSNGFSITGFPANSLGGWSVSGAGDVNADGIVDLVIGTHVAPADGPGISFVLFGQSGLGSSGSVSVSSLTGSNGFSITGFPTSSEGGASVSGAGDVNADGIADLVIGAPNASGGAGTSYVIFGKALLGSSGSVSVSTLTGSNGFAITGFPANSGGGWSVSGAGDVNADGIVDLVIGAPYASSNAGMSYVIFGQSGLGSSGSVSVSSLTGSNGFTITGFPASGAGGLSVSGAGDINKDGVADLLLGGNSASYVIFGKSGIGSSGSLDISMLTGANGFAISLPSGNGYVSGAGDLNKDGVADLIVGTPNAFSLSGASYVIFGEKVDTMNEINNSLTIKEGQTLVLNSQYLNATSVTQPAKYSTLQFTLSGIQHGRFFTISNPSVSLTNFLQQQVQAGQIQFAHDGSGWAPTYKVGVGYANMFASTPAQAATINFKQSFVLVNNNLGINQGQTLILTTNNLSANDLYYSPNNPNLVFSISGVQHGYFALTSSPSTPVTSFTQTQVQSGNVQFVHDGSTNPPSYNVGVINGISSLASQAATISFDVPPTLVTNTLTITQGQTVILTSQDLSAIDSYNPGNNPSLIFSVSNVQNGFFTLTSAPAILITSFTQAQIQAGQVQFVHDGSVNIPSYSVSVSDGRAVSGTQASVIYFHPIQTLIHNTLTLNAGQSIVLTPQNLNATALDESNSSLIIFTVAEVTNGYFAYVDFPTTPILSFSQADIDNGEVEFVSNGGQQAPSYSISVSEQTAVLDPEPATITFGNAPQILVNQLTISKGGTQYLDLNHLHAQAPSATNSTLLFLVNDVHHGKFENYGQSGTPIGNFTQQQLINGNIQFVHDGSNSAPGYSLTALNTGDFSGSSKKLIFHVSALSTTPSIGYSSAASPAKVWFQAGRITLPQLKYNRLYIMQGGKKIISSQELLAINMQGSPVFNTTFLINGLTHGQFTSVINPNISHLNFTQSQVAAGNIQFVHDGSANVPSYQVIVNQGPYFSAPYPALIAFRPIYNPPQIIGQLPDQTVTVDEAFSFPLTTSIFSDTAPLHFLASTVGGSQLPSWIHFDNVTNYFSGVAATPGITSIQVTAKDAAHLTTSTFFSLKAQPQLQSQSHTSSSGAIIGGVLGGVIGLMLLVMRCYIGRQAQTTLQKAADDATQKITRALAKEIFEKVKLTGCCGYLSESAAKAYIKASENIVLKLDLVNKTQPISWIDEIVNQIKKQANKSYCYSFFKPEISPQELSDKAEIIVRAVQHVLSVGVGESTPRSDDVEMSDVRVLSA